MDKPLTQYIREDKEPMSLADYEKAGGYGAVRKALREMAPEQVTQEVKDSNLRGRGGAGFPTGMKWSFVPLGEDAPQPKYIVMNADEMEPGAFKDRLLLESAPHLIIESMILAGYAIQAEVGYIFLRWAYRTAARRLREAIAEAYSRGRLGRNILGSDFNFDLHLHVSAGRYMCGEETGLLNALEGRRATPRAKPPFPPVVGAFGKPTIVNNVETLCNVPSIVANGSDWFQELAPDSEDSGTKLYAVSGKVNRTGVWELPIGATVREIIEEHAGGMQDGLQVRGVIPGGGSTNFLTADQLDVKMDYVSVEAAGSRLGTGTMIVMDEQTCPVGMLYSLELFFSRESCGWCTPCRDGLPWVAKILKALEEGKGQSGDIEILEEHTNWLGPGNTFCALAPGAIEPLKGLVNYYRDDIERHITEKRCPWR